MAKKLIGLDLDGTVLTKNKTITPHTKAVLEQAIQQGNYIVPVTGRPASGLPKDLLSISGIRYAITSNGATTYDLCQHKILRKYHIPTNHCADILHAVDGYDVIKEVFIKGYGYETVSSYQQLTENLKNTPMYSYIKASRKSVPDLYTLLSSSHANVEGISIMCHTEKQRDKIHSILKDFADIRIVFPSPRDLEINHSGADKGAAILELGKLLGIEKNFIMAIGDSDNDYGLLSAVGFPIAMANASCHIKEISSFITTDNEHEGVANAIEAFVL